MRFLFGALLATVSFAMSAQAQSNLVYACEYNLTTNRFGTIDLLSGNFTKISSIGSVLINDIAYCPTNGIVYGISNTTALVMFNKTNGTITRVAAFSVSGIESLAFRYSDGALFGATSSELYKNQSLQRDRHCRRNRLWHRLQPEHRGEDGAETSASRRTAISTSAIQAQTPTSIGSTPPTAPRRGWEKLSVIPT